MARLSKWGNSMGLRLPIQLCAVAGLRPGDEVIVRLLDDGTLLLTPSVLHPRPLKVERTAVEVEW